MKTDNTFEAFKTAVEEAFSTTAVNPAVCFTPSKGWFVESLIHQSDPESLCRVAANYNADTGSMSIGGRTEGRMKKSWIETL